MSRLASPNISPTDQAQVRAALARMLSQTDDLEAAINQVASEVNALEALIGGVSITFGESANAGAPLRIGSDGLAYNADCTTIDNARVRCLAAEDATADGEFQVVVSSRLSMADWTSIIGTTNLTPGLNYFLSSSTGQLTIVPPSAAGSVVVRVGYAVTDEIFQVDITTWVLL